jgi:hypothetical protein
MSESGCPVATVERKQREMPTAVQRVSNFVLWRSFAVDRGREENIRMCNFYRPGVF